MSAKISRAKEVQPGTSSPTEKARPVVSQTESSPKVNPHWLTLINDPQKSATFIPSEQTIYESVGLLLYELTSISDSFSIFRSQMRKNLIRLLSHIGRPGETSVHELQSIWHVFNEYNQEIHQNTRLAKASWFVLENAYQSETIRLLNFDQMEEKRALQILVREYRLVRARSDLAGEFLDFEDFQTLHYMLTQQSHVKTAYVQIAHLRNRELIKKLNIFRREVLSGKQPDTIILSEAKRRIQRLAEIAPLFKQSFNRAIIIELHRELLHSYTMANDANYDPSLFSKVTSGIKGAGKGVAGALASPFVEAFMLGHDLRVWFEKRLDSSNGLNYQSLPGKWVSGQESPIETYHQFVDATAEQMFQAEQQIRQKGNYEGLFRLISENLAEAFMPKFLKSKKAKSSQADINSTSNLAGEGKVGRNTTESTYTAVDTDAQIDHGHKAWNDHTLSEQAALDMYKDAGVVKPLSDAAVVEKLQQGYRFNPNTRKWSKPFGPGANKRQRKSTVGFLNEALRKVSDPHHPLHKLVVVVDVTDGKPVYGWRTTTRVTKSGKSQTGRYPGNDDGVVAQVGHQDAFASGQAEKFMLEDADFNIADGNTIESKRAFSYKVSVEVEGVSVDLRSLKQWERLGVVPQGTVASATSK